jgi:hypothetical protein
MISSTGLEGRPWRHLILDASHRVIEVDLLTWGRCLRAARHREVARTEVGYPLVLTSFAGIDISFGDGP